jgi:hypothetical protein
MFISYLTYTKWVMEGYASTKINKSSKTDIWIEFDYELISTIENIKFLRFDIQQQIHNNINILEKQLKEDKHIRIKLPKCIICI